MHTHTCPSINILFFRSAKVDQSRYTPREEMDLDLFGAFNESESKSSDAPQPSAEPILFVPKAKRRRHAAEAENSTVAAVPDTVLEDESRTAAEKIVSEADLPVFTDELVTKTDSGNTLKQVSALNR